MDENPVVHFEMSYEDPKRAAEFYKRVFGWQMNETGPEMGGYIVAQTTETKDGRPVRPGHINGGLYPREASPYQYPSVVIAVKDLEQAMKNVEQAGGKIIGKPHDIPTVGKYVSFTDTEGNRVSLLQP